MSQVLSDVYSLIVLDERSNRAGTGGLSAWHAQEISSTIQTMVLCERMIVNSVDARRYEVDRFCNQFDGLFALEDLGEELGSDSFRYENLLHAQDQYLARAQVYLACAQKLGVYLSLHPRRGERLKDAISRDSPRFAAEIAVDRLDRKMGESSAAEYAGVDLQVPAVAEYVMAFASSKQVDLVTAINEVRSSQNATRFREWCAEIDAELASDQRGRTSIRPVQKILREVEAVEKNWASDIDDLVRYRRRQISLRKVWCIGELLESFGLAAIDVNDPIISASKPHLLFLNDLYRTA